MKNIFFVSVLLILIVTNCVHANSYDNNQDYEYIATGSGGVFYLNLKSVYIQVCNPPYYQISGTIIHVNGDNSRKISSFYEVKLYNYDARESFTLDEHRNWIKDVFYKDLSGKYDMVSHRKIKIANALFKVARGINFYD